VIRFKAKIQTINLDELIGYTKNVCIKIIRIHIQFSKKLAGNYDFHHTVQE